MWIVLLAGIFGALLILFFVGLSRTEKPYRKMEDEEQIAYLKKWNEEHAKRKK
ncbi:MAG TPA: hypothetical protein PLN48_14145 [Lachnospiraceae bacterium]|nr:hypothetical protein [Lachnospiraceae bacterium]